MKRPPTNTPPPALSPIVANAVYSKRILCSALGWEQRSWTHATKAGLRIIPFGKQRFVLGRDVLSFFEKLAAGQDESPHGGDTTE